MEHPLEGPCCVCGVTTTHRCSPCVENGFDLFLCGREHQKLIWFAHKRVCGVNSKPFHLPLLSTAEYALAEELLHKPRTYKDGTGFTIADNLAKLTQYPLARIPALLDELYGKTTSSAPFEHDGIFRLLALIRSFLYTGIGKIAQEDQTPTTMPTAVSSELCAELFDPHIGLGYMLRTFAVHTGNANRTTEYYPRAEPWYTALCHVLLVFLSIRYRQMCPTQTPMQALLKTREHLSACGKRLEEIFELAKQNGPRVATHLLNVLRQMVFEGGVELAIEVDWDTEGKLEEPEKPQTFMNLTRRR